MYSIAVTRLVKNINNKTFRTLLIYSDWFYESGSFFIIFYTFTELYHNIYWFIWVLFFRVEKCTGYLFIRKKRNKIIYRWSVSPELRFYFPKLKCWEGWGSGRGSKNVTFHFGYERCNYGKHRQAGGEEKKFQEHNRTSRRWGEAESKKIKQLPTLEVGRPPLWAFFCQI